LRSSRWLSPQPRLRTNQDRYVIDRTYRAAHFGRLGNSRPAETQGSEPAAIVLLDAETRRA